jgi:hypothetical protein
MRLPHLKWTGQRAALLGSLVGRGMTVPEIAGELDTSERSIRCAASRLGLYFRGRPDDACCHAGDLLDKLAPEHRAAFTAAARRRNASTSEVALRALTLLAADDLLNAVLDDTEQLTARLVATGGLTVDAALITPAVHMAEAAAAEAAEINALMQQMEQPDLQRCAPSPSGRALPGTREPAPYSITSSARASSVGGTSMPSALAVVRLTTRSNLVGCSTGRSPALAPRRILST